jgi:hypothetical protein
MTTSAKQFSTVALNWKEVWYTNCPVVSASNVDQELGWTKEEFKKIGAYSNPWKLSAARIRERAA